VSEAPARRRPPPPAAGRCPCEHFRARHANLTVAMAVRLRLTRIGGRKNPIWRVVVADQRSKRDGRVIETVGHYNAQTNPSTIVLNEERIRDWLSRGAQPSESVRKLLRTQNIA
jgi:small subunit ribosomal protein S16